MSTLLVNIYMGIFFFARINTWEVGQIQPAMHRQPYKRKFSSVPGVIDQHPLGTFSWLYCHHADFTTT